MAIIKCKMCGGDLKLIDGECTAQCEYCGSVQTVPKADDEKKINLFARANRFYSSQNIKKCNTGDPSVAFLHKGNMLAVKLG